MVNEDFVRHFLRGMDPLKQRLVMRQFIPGVTQLGPPVDWQIVGVFHTVRSFGPRRGDAEIDIPFWQTPWNSASVGVRTAVDPASMLKSVAEAVRAVDPQIGLAKPRTMEQIRDDGLANDRFTMILFACFAGAALLLAAIGVYGVMAFSVAQRSREIAVRMALGSSRGRIVARVVGEGLTLAAMGFVLGLIGAYFVGRGMRSILFEVGAVDLAAFSAVGLLLLMAALLASYVPARRAASVDPMQALRHE